MWAFKLFLLTLFLYVTCQERQDPVLYYYGIDESERSLPLCDARAACSTVLQRYWRAPALLRLCRCPRRARCDELAPEDRRIELNNRAHFQTSFISNTRVNVENGLLFKKLSTIDHSLVCQTKTPEFRISIGQKNVVPFCKPISDWPVCAIGDVPLRVESTHDRIDPEDIEDKHHKNIQLSPPQITFKCRCRHPTYWKLNYTTESEDVQQYQCAPLPSCKTGELCGHVTGDLYALYQSCMCSKHHICVQSGGLPEVEISELLYRGKGWRAHCERISDEYSYEDN